MECKVSYYIAHCGEAHTIGDNFIINRIGYIVSGVLGVNHQKVIKNAPLSYSTVSRRIEDVSCNIE
jgi:hypothetical protein